MFGETNTKALISGVVIGAGAGLIKMGTGIEWTTTVGIVVLAAGIRIPA